MPALVVDSVTVFESAPAFIRGVGGAVIMQNPDGPLPSERVKSRGPLGALALSALVVLTGCSFDEPVHLGSTAAPSTSVSATATQQAIGLLRASTTFIDQTSFLCSVQNWREPDEFFKSTNMDRVHQNADIHTTFAYRSTEARMIGPAIYLKTGPNRPGAGEGWMTLDPHKIPADILPSFSPGNDDPCGSARLINAIVTAKLSEHIVGGTLIDGTIDMTKIGAGIGITGLPDAFPDSVHHQRFVAEIDDQGRLDSFVIPAGLIPETEVRYGSLGLPVTVPEPPHPTPAPDALYQQLASTVG